MATDPPTSAARYAAPKDVPDWNRRMRLCRDCGSLLFDTEKHDEWHEHLESVARAAARGDMMTRRIG